MITIQLVQYEPISLRYHQLENKPLRNSMARKLPLIFFFSFLIQKFRDYTLFDGKKKKLGSIILRSIYPQLYM